MKIQCPSCRATFTTPTGLSGRVGCSRCNHRFEVTGEPDLSAFLFDASAPAAFPPPAAPVVAEPKPAQATVEAAPAPRVEYRPARLKPLAAVALLLSILSLAAVALVEPPKEPAPIDVPVRTADVRPPAQVEPGRDLEAPAVARLGEIGAARAKPVDVALASLDPRLGPGQLFPVQEDLPREKVKPPQPRDPPAPLVVPRGVLERIGASTEEDLRQRLAETPEVGLGISAPFVLNAHAALIRERMQQGAPVFLVDATPLIRTRPDLAGLPLRHGLSCQLHPKAAGTMEDLSRKLRVYLTSVGVASVGGQPGPALLREVLMKEMRGKRPAWLRPEAIPTMMQMLMPEDAPIRQILVDMLAEIPGPQSTAALAQRAVFDLDAGVRKSAVAALKEKDRRAEDYRVVFLRGLRYPWAPAADHAAEALATLDDRAVVPELVALLKQPDPTMPVVLNKRHAVLREVVRANHLTNCLLCHPPAVTTNEPVLGLDPVLTVPASAGFSTVVTRLQNTPGSHGYGGAATTAQVPRIVQVPLLIRGDITYLRQDFSVRQPGNPAGPTQPGAPQTVRFDYLVRTRHVPAGEAQQLLNAVGNKPYPQRDAVLHALRRLTGKDAGPSTEAWLEAFPGAEVNAEAARLSRQLRYSGADQRDVMLNKWSFAKGEATVLALANAIPGLRGKQQDRARQILADRLTSLSPKSLCEKLREDDPELRRAVIEVCQRREKKELVPELLVLLEDSDPVAAKTAEAALKDVTGQGHTAPADWQRWWRKQ